HPIATLPPPLSYHLFFRHVPAHHLALHSFPTRRSSDLARRQVDHQVIELAPLHVVQEVAQRLGQHRPPPDHRLTRLEDGAERHQDRKSTRLNSSHVKISYAVFCLKKKKKKRYTKKIQ